jgi:hypothetical protein
MPLLRSSKFSRKSEATTWLLRCSSYIQNDDATSMPLLRSSTFSRKSEATHMVLLRCYNYSRESKATTTPLLRSSFQIRIIELLIFIFYKAIYIFETDATKIPHLINSNYIGNSYAVNIPNLWRII